RRHAARAAPDRARARALADHVRRAHPGPDGRGVGTRRVRRRRPRGGNRAVRGAALAPVAARTAPDQVAAARHARRPRRPARSGGVRRLPDVGGRARGRRRLPREARGALDRTVKLITDGEELSGLVDALTTVYRDAFGASGYDETEREVERF